MSARKRRADEAPCGKCGGSGWIRDRRVEGAEWRERRQRAGKTLRAVAESMGYTLSYLCDLELGRRDWNMKLREEYREAL